MSQDNKNWFKQVNSLRFISPHMLQVLMWLATVARGIPLYGAACKTCSGYAGENPVVIGGPALKLTTFLEL
jgi:hypothetical protein